MPGDYVYENITGVLQSATRKTNQNGREFMEAIIDGREYTIWDDPLKGAAESAVGLHISGSVRRKEGSRYWQLMNFSPVDESTPRPNTSVSVAAPMDEMAIRLQCLGLAIEAHKGLEDIKNASVIEAYATALEAYVLDKAAQTPKS